MDAVNREGFRIAHDISAYSFVAMAKACRTMLNPNSALLTLSYRCGTRYPELQHYGSGKSVSGSERPLYGERDGERNHPC